jgi:hypothetical protein
MFCKRLGFGLLTMALVMVAAVPALAAPPIGDRDSATVANQESFAPTGVVYAPVGGVVFRQFNSVMGREGGVLSLLGTGQSGGVIGAGPVFQSVHNGRSASYVVYAENKCLGREGGALSLLGVGQTEP